jgi:hypothetical protein
VNGARPPYALERAKNFFEKNKKIFQKPIDKRFFIWYYVYSQDGGRVV